MYSFIDLSNLDPTFFYYAAVIALALFILFRGLMRIKRVEADRVTSAKHMDYSAPIEIESADSDTASIVRKRAVNSIGARFDFIRYIFIPLVIGVTLLFLIVPLMPSMSKTYVSLMAGVLTVLVGIAGKPVIENAISGIVITLSQPIKINDTVIIDGKYGTIEKINFLYTVVKVWNWRRYIIPNHSLLQKEFENLSQTEEQEWTHVDFYISPGSDMELVKKIAKECMICPHLDDVEPPSFWVMDLQKDAVLCWVAGWAKNPAEAWALKSVTRRKLVTALDQHKINFQLIHSKVDLINEAKV